MKKARYSLLKGIITPVVFSKSTQMDIITMLYVQNPSKFIFELVSAASQSMIKPDDTLYAVEIGLLLQCFHFKE